MLKEGEVKKNATIMSVSLAVALVTVSNASAGSKNVKLLASDGVANEYFRELVEVVDSLVDEGMIDVSMANPLFSKVAAAIRSADKKNICAAANQLEAIVNQLNAQRGKNLSDEVVDQLIPYADSVVSELRANSDGNCSDVNVPSENDAPPQYNIPDTGQETSFTSTFGEDSDYAINPPSYTVFRNGTVIDNITSHVWQQKNDNLTRTWDDAGSYCANLTLGGQSEWRLPTLRELSSLLKLSPTTWPGIIPRIDTVAFPDTESYLYWTSETAADEMSAAWSLSFRDGFAYRFPKTAYVKVRCVSGQESSSPSFTDNGDSTVSDNVTGLMWQQDDGRKQSFDEALNYCEDLSLGGYNDWRLPNYKELESISDKTKFKSALDKTYFRGNHSDYSWTSTTYVLDPSKAYLFSGDLGLVIYFDKGADKYSRCVR